MQINQPAFFIQNQKVFVLWDIGLIGNLSSKNKVRKILHRNTKLFQSLIFVFNVFGVKWIILNFDLE